MFDNSVTSLLNSESSFSNISPNSYVYRFNRVSVIWTILQEQLSTQCSNIGTELIIDYGGEFTTYEIFQSREALINWAREVDKSQGFFNVIKRSDASGNGKNRRVLLSCDR